jgi:hypothetical protein
METTGSFVDRYQYFGVMFWQHVQGGRSNPEGRGRRFLRDVGTYLPNALRQNGVMYCVYEKAERRKCNESLSVE